MQSRGLVFTFLFYLFLFWCFLFIFYFIIFYSKRLFAALVFLAKSFVETLAMCTAKAGSIVQRTELYLGTYRSPSLSLWLYLSSQL